MHSDLSRVEEKLDDTIMAFLGQRLRTGLTDFHMGDLVDFVQKRSAVAPDSASRILRSLRLRKLIDYTLLSRSDSLYRIRSIPGHSAAKPREHWRFV